MHQAHSIQGDEIMEATLATDIREYMKEYFEAWTEGDVENILAYFTDDVTISLLGVPVLLEGKAAVTEGFVVPFAKGFPGNIHHVLNLVHEGNQVVVEWMFTAVHSGNFAGIPATGRSVKLPGCSVYTVEGGKISRGLLYYNGPTLMEQLGVTG
jgi:steroid delta-isomerase-like uncharacterized protein